MICIPGVVRPI